MTDPQPGAGRTPPASVRLATTGARATPTWLPARWRGLVVRLGFGILAVAGLFLAIPSGYGLLWFVPYTAVGTVLIVRRPGMLIGWLLLAIGWLLVVQSAPVGATVEQFSAGAVPWPLLVLSWAAGGPLGFGGFLLLACLAIVFPSGRLPDDRWGRGARIILAAVTVLVALAAVGPTINVNLIDAPNGAIVRNPLAVAPDAWIWQALNPTLMFLLVVGLLFGGAVSLVIRHRRARGVERQQLSWVVAAFAFVGVAVIGGLVLGGLVPQALDSGIVWVPAIVAFATVPISVGIAVLRYRLYEIDRIVSRTIGWAVVSAVLVAVFIALVLVTQAALASITSSNTFAVAGSTLVVAALFQPLRRRVQARVDQRFNRAHFDAERTVTAFTGRLRDDVELDQLRAAITSTIGRTVQPASVSLWLRGRREAGPRASL
jgi:hypothetical protein